MAVFNKDKPDYDDLRNKVSLAVASFTSVARQP